MSCVRLDTSRNSSTLSSNNDMLDHQKNVDLLNKENKIINPHNLDIGSTVKCTDTDQCGVIKWIGTLSGSNTVNAKVEMVRFWYMIYYSKSYRYRRIMLMLVLAMMGLGWTLNILVVNQTRENL